MNIVWQSPKKIPAKISDSDTSDYESDAQGKKGRGRPRGSNYKPRLPPVPGRSRGRPPIADEFKRKKV